MKKKIKTISKIKYGEKFTFRVVAVLFSVILWLIITNVLNPNYVKTFSDVKIEFLGEKLFLDKYSITNKYDDTVSVTLSGRRNDLIKLNSSDIKPYVDFKDAKAGKSNLNIKFRDFPTNAYIKKMSISNVSIDADKNIEKEMNVKVHKIGQIEGNNWAEFKVEKQFVKIKGAANEVEKVSEVAVVIDITEMKKDTSGEYALEILSKEKSLTKPKVKLEIDKVRVDTIIYSKKELDVEIKLVGKPKGDIELVKYEVEPKKVLVSAPLKELASVKKIKSHYIDLSKYNEIGENSEKLVFLNSNTKLDKEQNPIVKFYFDKKIEKVFSVPISKVKFNGVNKVKIENITYPSFLKFKVKGYSTLIEKIKEDDFLITAEVNEDTKGSFSLPYICKLKPNVDDKSISIEKIYDKITIQLK